MLCSQPSPYSQIKNYIPMFYILQYPNKKFQILLTRINNIISWVQGQNTESSIFCKLSFFHSLRFWTPKTGRTKSIILWARKDLNEPYETLYALSSEWKGRLHFPFTKLKSNGHKLQCAADCSLRSPDPKPH